jgi:hypothetical protein
MDFQSDDFAVLRDDLRALQSDATLALRSLIGTTAISAGKGLKRFGKRVLDND